MAGPGVAGALALLVTAWFLPIMSISWLVFWKNEVSIIEIAGDLFADNEIFVFLVVTVFSMAFPAVKLLATLTVWLRVDASSASAARAVAWIQALGRWSMVDVFVVALLVVAIKTTLISDVSTHLGIYVFCGAIGLSMLVVHWVARQIAQRAEIL